MATNTLMHTDFEFIGQTNKYTGKVREVYTLDTDTLIMVSTDRLSAFDVVMPRGIPFKGQILNQIAMHMMQSTADLVPIGFSQPLIPMLLLEKNVPHLKSKW